jgi:3'(2'), 5'-bisphosphate nucleotidase
MRLNHFWLVDPLDSGGTGLHHLYKGTLSIALIEDQKPIYGVVYVPGSDTVFYAAQGKGAFKAQGDAPAIRLGLRETDNSATFGVIYPESAEKTAGSRALMMCQIAEGSLPPGQVLRHSKEWQTAAGDAILRAVGLRLLNCGTQDQLTYNKADLSHDCLVVG